ncbi:MAG TPA: DUF2142 domain-containing protein [Marmoricola sp.]|nr:DUF2142 domain-containing protein [Nocardioidaceae bacterium]MCB8992637.1 DUF2142 domain-containing protein [Nocardioidaceae bacterium]MCO5324289.1 DUF2142 domain-containing protein [Nocardioidaceae bacterium]HRV69112.1 DUF2142 domain-containing protein [Marmoricola sp.]
MIRSGTTRIALRPTGGWVAFIGFALIFGIWSLATPLWSTPDSTQHDLYAYTLGHGNLTPEHTNVFANGVTTNTNTPVPLGVLRSVESVDCYQFKPENPASCMRNVNSGSELVPYVNAAGRNFPVYYAVTGVLSNFGTNAQALYLERFAAVLLAAWMMAWAVTGCLQMRRPGLATMGVLLSLTPMLAYLGGAVNPNTFEIVAAYALVACSLAFFANPDGPAAQTMFRRAMIAAAIVGSTRILGPAWLGVWALGLLIIYGKSAWTLTWTSRSRRLLLVPVLAVIANIVWLQYSGVDNIRKEPLFDLSLWERIRLSAHSMNGVLTQMIGNFGWLDTPLPPNLWIAYTAVILFVIGTVWAVLTPRHALAALAILVLSWVLPVMLQAWKLNLQGPVWQGRYMLPTVGMIPIMIMALAANSPASDTNWNGRLARWSRIGSIGVLAVLHLWAFQVMMRRNVSGIRAEDMPPAEWADWAPPLGSTALFVSLAVVMAGWLALLARTRMSVEAQAPAAMNSSAER